MSGVDNVTKEKVFAERRVYRRYKAQDGSFAAVRDGSTKLGPIKNISKGGLAFTYIAEGDKLPESFSVDVFFSGEGFYLKDVPSNKISDSHVNTNSPISSLVIKEMGIQFKELKHDQQKQLDNFIRDFTIKR